jgi:hypothetical protein
VSETLWLRAGFNPAPLPPIAFDALGQPWTDLANNPEGREACGFTPAPPYPDHDPATQAPVWNGAGWDLAALPEVPPETRRVPKVDFFRRFTDVEKVAIYGARKRIAEMTSEEFADIANIGWWKLALVFETLDLIPEFIELDHPETLDALSAFAQSSFIHPDRINDILS